MSRRRHFAKHINLKRFIPFLCLCLLLLFVVINGIAALFKRPKTKYDDTILGADYVSEPMPIPTATPTPTMPPDFIVETARHEADFIEIYNQYVQRIAYLTFDDGPTEKITPQILDILKEKGVTATFFVLGQNVEKYPDLAKRAVSEGHALANHSYSHVYDSVYHEDINAFKDELQRAENAVINTLGGDDGYVKVFRFPAGSFGDAYDAQKQALLEMGYKYIDWNAISGDAEGQSVSPETQLAYVKKTVGKKRNAVILMHDAATKQTTADALPAIIDYLKGEGFVFKTLKDAMSAS